MVKKILRQTLRSEIHDYQNAHGADSDAAIQRLFFKTQHLMPQSVVAGYIALKGEVSAKGLLSSLSNQGHIICLPVITGRTDPMVFRLYKPGDSTRTGIMGQQEPLL